MHRLTALIRRHPLIAFFVLAYAFAWSLTLLTSVSLVFGFIALFGPAAAALIVAAVTDGRAGVRDLLRRVAIWRVAPGWYVVALGLPALLSLGVVGLGRLLGTPGEARFSDLSPLTLTLFVLVIGEELGWRGFALPRLQARFGALGASLLLGLLWAAWHLPNQFIPGLEVYGYGFPAFACFVVAMTVLFTWLANHTGGSVLLAWLFHGAINTLIVVNPAMDLVQRWWLSAAVYGVVAVLITWFHPSSILRWRRLHRPQPYADAVGPVRRRQTGGPVPSVAWGLPARAAFDSQNRRVTVMTGYASSWWVIGLRGLVAVLLGVACFVWPAAVLEALVIVFGAFALVDGGVALVGGLVAAGGGRRWWPMVLVGLIGIVAGGLALVWPGLTVLALLGVIAGWAVLSGIAQIVGAVQLRREIDDEWLLGLSGLASVVVGALLVIFPLAGLVAITYTLGAYAIVYGGMLLALAVRLRQLGRPRSEPSSTEGERRPAGA